MSQNVFSSLNSTCIGEASTTPMCWGRTRCG
jgi:hypothetical protein